MDRPGLLQRVRAALFEDRRLLVVAAAFALAAVSVYRLLVAFGALR